jgi:hypothetical protein
MNEKKARGDQQGIASVLWSGCGTDVSSVFVPNPENIFKETNP